MYPQLSDRVYRDHIDWSRDIQERYREIIEEIERLPMRLRVRWGEIKNLLDGVTTVMDHTVQPLALEVIDRIAGAHYIHSIPFHTRARLQLLKLWGGSPVTLHLCEGQTARARAEAEIVRRWNIGRREIVAVHGIGLTRGRGFRGLVWCPDSNLRLYGATAPIDDLCDEVPIVFGTDATLSADACLSRHLKRARALGLLSDREVFDALSATASAVWRLEDRGRIAPGLRADLVIARKKCADPWDAFFEVTREDILFVWIAGRPVLIDDALIDHEVAAPFRSSLTRFVLPSGSAKWTPWDIASLWRETARLSARACPPLA